MPSIVKITDYSQYRGVDRVSICGVVTRRALQKKFSFFELKDQSGQIQVVLDSKFAKDITVQSYVLFTGVFKDLPPEKKSKLPIEFQAESVEILSQASSDAVAICPEEASSEVRLAERHMYLRQPDAILKTRLRDKLVRAIRSHFSDLTEIFPPSFTGVECEGGATLFKVEHPGRSVDKPMTAYLTQSSQFALEMALPGVGDCYCIAPSFRAEHSHTRRHLTEFLHAEAEWGCILKFEDHLEKLKSLLRGVLKHFLELASVELKEYGCYTHVEHLYEMSEDILVLEHKDAIRECAERGIFKDEEKKEPFSERDDIPEAQERALIDSIGKIVFLVKFPKEFKSFYMALDPEDDTRVLGCDVEVPGVGEIIGSGVREQSFERLEKRLEEQGLKPDDYREYLDLRKYGFHMTSGMGLGVDRMLVWLLDEHSIRDVVTFPRFPGYLRP